MKNGDRFYINSGKVYINGNLATKKTLENNFLVNY